MVTTSKPAKRKVGTKSWKLRTLASTLPTDLLVTEAGLRQQGRRIRRLRLRSGLKQWEVAKKIRVGTRQVQNYEKKGIEDFSRIKQLAELHWKLWAKDDPEWAHLSPEWLWDGKRRDKTPDVIGALNGGSQEQLERIEAALEKIRATQVELRSGQAKVLEAVDRLQRRRPAQPSHQKRGGSGRAASGS